MRDDLLAACLVEGIELIEPIGQGGSATVFSARWQDRDVAVKVLDSGASGQPPRPLAHPAILDVLGKGRALGQPYLILERFPTDLRQALDGRPLRSDWLRPVLVPLLDAIEFAHRRGVLHGDIKPANVLVDLDARPARVALADFGMCQLSSAELEASMLSQERSESGGMATLAYMAPERRSGAPPSAASDVYALGVLIFEVLTGRQPAGLELPSELVPGLGRAFDGVVKAALAQRPQDRSSLLTLRRALLRALPRDTFAEQEPEMAYIPGGCLVVGDREDPDARPMCEVRLRPYWIDLTPVTNGAYLEFVRTTGARRPSNWPPGNRLPKRLERLPVTEVSWQEARAYAEWAGRRLPSEWEWERAAQGPEHRRYPYGEELDLSRIHADPRRLAPVDSHPEGASSEGVLGLTGNGWEWTGSAYAPYGTTPPARVTARVIRGGYDPARPLSGSATFRAALRPDARDPGVTFRCALDAD